MIALRTAGKSKRSIARDLGINRETVDTILAAYQTDQPSHAKTIHDLTTKAFVRVSEAIETQKDTDTARWALEHTVFKPAIADQWHIGGDLSVQTAIGLLPATATDGTQLAGGARAVPSPDVTGDTQVTGATEAAAKPTPQDMSLSIHTNFSAFSLAELEAEVARRRAATVIDVESTDAK